MDVFLKTGLLEDSGGYGRDVYANSPGASEKVDGVRK